MPSFEFADCPTGLELAPSADGSVAAGSLRCTLRNSSTRRQTARIRIEPLGGARSEWFALTKASSTSPLEIEEDLDAGSTLSVEATVKVNPQPVAVSYSFRLRVTSETAPDTDFAEGPAVAFDVPAAKVAPQPAPSKFPWWAIAVAAVFVVLVIGAITFLAWPKSLDPKLVIGKKLVDAVKIASQHGLENVQVVSGAAWGNNPADRVVVGFEPRGPRFEVDDGVTIPADALGRPYAETVQRLLDVGVIPTMPVLGQIGGPEGVVMMTAPPPGVPIPLGTPVLITVGARPFPPAFVGGQFPCLVMPGNCSVPARTYTIDDLNAVARDRLKNRDQMVDLILNGQ